MFDFLSALKHGPEGRVLVVTWLYYPIYDDRRIVDVEVRSAHGRLVELCRLSLAELAWCLSSCPSSLTLVWEANLPVPLVLKDYLWTYPSDEEDLP